jgi:hypothetical protein
VGPSFAAADLRRDGVGVGRAREKAEVPLSARAHRRDKLQPWLSGWFAALLVLAPFARSPVPVHVAAAPTAAPDALMAHDGIEGRQPTTQLRPVQPLAPGILSRASLLEIRLALPRVKSPLLSAGFEQPVLALEAVTAFGGKPREVLQRSAVGTARTTTGPPA